MVSRITRTTPPPVAASDGTTGVYGITVAAELTGMSVQALRLYERKGLVEPNRTSGGTRRYSDTDIARLRHIGTATMPSCVRLRLPARDLRGSARLAGRRIPRDHGAPGS